MATDSEALRWRIRFVLFIYLLAMPKLEVALRVDDV